MVCVTTSRPPTTGVLLGRIFIDANRSGGWDPGEPFVKAPNTCSTGTIVAGVEIGWQGLVSGRGAPQYCNPGPYFHSATVPAGSYQLSATVPPGWLVSALGGPSVEVRGGTHVWFALVAPGPVLSSQSCAAESSLRSMPSTTLAPVQFLNGSGAWRHLYWLDFDGRRVLYETMAPGQSIAQDTYLTHPWVVTDPAGVCVGIYLPALGAWAFLE